MAIAPLANVTTPLVADIVLPSILMLSTCKSPVIRALPTTSNSFPDVGVELVSDVGFINNTAVEILTGELTPRPSCMFLTDAVKPSLSDNFNKPS